jgi:hypothetical protein
LGNRCIGKIKNNAAVLLDFSIILFLYLAADKVLKACPISLKYTPQIPLRRARSSCFSISNNLRKMSVTLTFDYVINPVILLVGGVTGVVIGFGLGRAKLARSEAKLRKMEEELLHSHYETLESQHAFAELESHLKNQAIPVIPMKISGNNKETPKEKEKATK